MIKLLSLLVLLPLLSIGDALALDAERITQLAAEPHSRENMIPELSIYPEARKYQVRMTMTVPDPSIEPLEMEFEASEKVVGGRYLVSKAMLPDEEKPMIMVVTYDAEESLFKKWVLAPDGEIFHAVGLADHEHRSMAWSSIDGERRTLGIEQHSDEKTTWTEVMMLDGKAVFRTVGEALKRE